MIYADLESLFEKVYGRKNNLEKLSATKVSEHITCGCSLSIIYTFDGLENKHDVYKDKDCMKMFFEF